MARTISANTQTELDNLGAESYTTLSITLASGGSPLLYSTREGTVLGSVYDGSFLFSNDLTQSLESPPTRVEVTLSNVDKVAGLKFKTEDLIKAKAEFGRYYPGAGEIVPMFTGTIRPLDVKEGEARLEIVSDLVAAGYCVAQYTLAPGCQAVYKDPLTCGYTGSKSSCSKNRKGPNSCQEHDAPGDDFKFFGLEYPFGIVVAAPPTGTGLPGDTTGTISGGGSGGGGGSGSPWDDNRASCFPAGTLITLSDFTEKPIEQIRRGDIVLSFDPKTLLLYARRVASPLQRHFTGRLISIDEGTLLGTPEHGIFNGRGGYDRLDDFRPGDNLFRLSGEWLAPREVCVWEIERRGVIDLAADVEVFNFEVAGFHNYFANRFAVSNNKYIYEVY